ncbi:hypothetical protein N4T77_00180 [Clostridium sp. CX1]|uniref:hypothetical protein n=1 Tax=Clostridium sp. CX1 TaxID=2978346 RepID=UPI0021BE3B96|nr:hypothetical protein [Clostridium sp. CX1]MCT8975005.1 hypothetical protein [Clostridium sp. CX1]
MREIMKRTKEIYQSYVDPKGNFYERPFGILEKITLAKKQDDFLRRYIYAIINTRLTSKATKIYIRNTGASVAAAIKNYNKNLKESERLNIKSCQSSIDYDTGKLLKYFPDEMLTEIIFYNCDLTRYEKQLNLALARYGKENKLLTDNLILKIHCNDVKDSCTDEEFSELMSIIAPYFKKSIQYVEDRLPESVGYLLYLMSTPSANLNFEDKQRYRILQGLIE